MQIFVEALRKDDIGLIVASISYIFEKIYEVTLRWEKLFCSGTHSSCCRRETGQQFLHLEHYVFCVTIIDLRSLTFKVAELNHFAYTPNTGKKRYMDSRNNTSN